MNSEKGEIYHGTLWEEDADEVVGLPTRQNPIVELWRFAGYSLVLYVPTMVIKKFNRHKDALKYAAGKLGHAKAINDQLEGE